MTMTFLVATVVAGLIAAALFGGVVPQGAPTAEMLSLALAALTAVAVASASALDG